MTYGVPVYFSDTQECHKQEVDCVITDTGEIVGTTEIPDGCWMDKSKNVNAGRVLQ